VQGHNTAGSKQNIDNTIKLIIDYLEFILIALSIFVALRAGLLPKDGAIQFLVLQEV
jgi:hypothetical protein